jgi:hypothetical protein
MIAGILVLIGVITLILACVAYWRGYRSGTLMARDAIAVAHAAFEHARGQWEDWERKAESFRSINSSILDERDKWQRLYTEQSIAHGNAQAIMMGAIEYMGKKLSIAGIAFQVPAVLEEVRQAFIQNHVTPMLANGVQGQTSLEKSSEKSDQVG